MEYIWKLKLGKEVSMVVCPVDDFTLKKMADSSIRVMIRNVQAKPIIKAEGYYVFVNLAQGEYIIDIFSDDYMDESLVVKTSELEPREKTVYINLKPRTSYPFPPSATLVRATVRDSNQKPLKDTEIRSSILSESCARGRLNKEGAKAGQQDIYLTHMIGSITEGEVFFLKDRSSGVSEYIRVLGRLDETKGYRLMEPLENNYGSGAMLFPSTSSQTDGRGEAVVYYRGLRAKNFEAKLEITHKGISMEKVILLEEGRTERLDIMI